MSKEIIQLYPVSNTTHPLKGLYLSHNIRELSELFDEPFVYANYVMSIDGRISIPHPKKKGQTVPKAIANDRDWRLFQELAAQADLIISSGRYLRDWADGRAQEILEVDDPNYADLRQWRKDQGLKPQPDIAIISGSLSFPIPDLLKANGRKVIVFTDEEAPKDKILEIEAQTGNVFIVGKQSVQGKPMLKKIKELGYKTVYNATGPKVMHLLLEAGVVNRLYLTLANRILGGTPFSTIVEGALFETAVDLKLSHLYYDSVALNGIGQQFLSFELQ